VAAFNRNTDKEASRPFADFSLQSLKSDVSVENLSEANSEVESTIESGESQYQSSFILAKISNWTGTFDDERLAFPELRTGEVTRTFR
jgi:hypothetical protein